MSSSSSPPNFGMILQDTKWVEPGTGKPTTYFFRLIGNLFNASGAGQAPFASDLVTLEYSSASARSGTDYERKIADLTTVQFGIPDTRGRIATLEKRVSDLEQLLQEALRKPPDISALVAQVAQLTALTMGSH